MISDFSIYAKITALCWILGVILLVSSHKKKLLQTSGIILIMAGVLVLSFFITRLWIKLERPPLRTLGETRLWYALFLSLTGLLVFIRWRLKWNKITGIIFLVLFVFMACLFLYINYSKPENFDKTLMPALQSPWFVPHVIVYIFAYTLLGLATLAAVTGLYQLYFNKDFLLSIRLADNLVYTGFAFLTFGLIFGALWAKEAWGHYWTWDPKETWALVTWLMYLIYIHIRYHRPKNTLLPLWTLSLSFVILLIAWFGINYLPSAQNSVHVYSGN